MPKRKPEITGLYYITHIDNLPSIFQHGILCHRLVEERGIDYTPIDDAAIVSSRRMRSAPDGKSLWEFVNVYFQPRNPIRMGKPYLYKREAFIDEELADAPDTLSEPNANKWFLLFATKRHWCDKGDLQAIREGLRWVKNNCAAEEIKSLAMPALGCGLGGLDWQDVGPVMCQELAGLGIQVAIYLPRERRIPEEYLSSQYLLSSVDSEDG